MLVIFAINLLFTLGFGQQYDSCRIPAVCTSGGKSQSVWIPASNPPVPTPQNVPPATTTTRTSKSTCDNEEIKRLRTKIRNLSDPGWINGNNGYQYWVSNRGVVVPYSNAEALCRSFNAEIATVGIRDDQSRKFIIDNILRRCTDVGAFWIGYTDKVKEGTFVWNDGLPQGNNTLEWAQGQPDNRNNNADCAVTVRYRDYKWDDYPCETANSGVLCERYTG